MAEKEYIEREATVLRILEKGQASRRYKLGDIWELDFDEIREAIAGIPAADVRPVVLCRDCRHRDPEDHKCDCGQFERAGCVFPVDDNYFCAYGEE